MTTSADDRLRMSLTDVALLARVQRPVVSVWRRRSAGTDRPFPAAAGTVDGREVFDAHEVSAWLAATGRGNNPTAPDDVAAFASLDESSPRTDRKVFDALSALLCLSVLCGRRVGELDRRELLDLADEHDPDDELLYAELEAVGDRVEALARYTDRIGDAAMNPAAAFETLMSGRFRSGLAEHAAVAVDAAALGLAAKIAVGLGARTPSPVYVDPSPGGSDLLLAVIREHGDRGPLDVCTARDDSPAARLARRRLRVHDVYRTDLDVDDSGAFALHGAATHVTLLPAPANPVLTDAQVLAAVENIVVQMDEAQNGVVLAPASALCNPLRDQVAAGFRADLLRTGHVRAVVRLPKGLVPARSRQALALWVLGPSHHEDEPAERRTLIADLADTALSADVVDSLVTDIVAATGTRDLVRAHAFRFLQPALTRGLLTTKRSLVESATPTTRPDDPMSVLLGIEQLRAVASPDIRLPKIVADPAAVPVRSTTVAAMLTAHRLRALAGNRLDARDLGRGAGATVLGPAELTGASVFGTRTIDRLVLAARYEAARLTEPGDVVFCTSPRPAAIVDRAGGSAVAFPARVLRIDAADPGGLHPDVLAADINAQPPGARQWRRWAIRTVSDAQRAPLTTALDGLGAARDAARRRLAQLDELADLITRAATGGALTLTPAEQPKGR